MSGPAQGRETPSASELDSRREHDARNPLLLPARSLREHPATTDGRDDRCGHRHYYISWKSSYITSQPGRLHNTIGSITNSYIHTTSTPHTHRLCDDSGLADERTSKRASVPQRSTSSSGSSGKISAASMLLGIASLSLPAPRSCAEPLRSAEGALLGRTLRQ